MTTQYVTKKLDINKPVHTTVSGVPKDAKGYVIRVINRKGDRNHAVIFEIEGHEELYLLREEDLFNVPESRWLNVYVYKDFSGEEPRPKWRKTRREADDGAYGTGRIAVIEDKQDGSPWILHQL